MYGLWRQKNYLVALIVVDSKDKNNSTIGSIIEDLNKDLTLIEKYKNTLEKFYLK